MELKLISDQGGTLDEYFDEHFSQRLPCHVYEVLKRTRELLRNIEQNVDALPHWVTISHGVTFALSEVDDYDTQKARVFVQPTANGFSIEYRISQGWANDNTLKKLNAKSDEEAVQLIQFALQNAIKAE